jgi:hypothetical protein
MTVARGNERMKGPWTVVAGAALLALVSWPAAAHLSADQVARLGKDLTPVGAERAGNADGTIPEWTGGLCEPPAGWDKQRGYVDPFPDDKPLFTITAANAAQYQEHLTAGTLALLKEYDNFKMHVYRTRRTACYPQFVYDTIKAEAGKIDLDGFGIINRNATTVPFPVPSSGLEAIWNHPLRYLGGGISRDFDSLPVRSNGDYFRVGAHEYRIFNQNLDKPQENLLLAFLAYLTAPATLQGWVGLVHEPVDQVKETRSAWVYNAGQRRVRRAPDLNYDSITDGTEGMRLADEFDGWNGAPDRFDWTLVGKREIYVPYNSYKLVDKSLTYDKDIIRKNTINPDLLRYELHRVWVVDGTLKQGSRHIYSRRTFYLDEDSWTVLYEDAYDSHKMLWRAGVHPMIEFYDAKVPWYAANVHHDLYSHNYLASFLQNQIKTPWEFGEHGRWRDFQPDALRRFAVTQ